MFGFSRNNSSAVKPIDVTIDEAHNLIANNRDILILDVRTPAEFSGGHIPNAINIPHRVLPVRMHEINKYKEKLILVHCQAGGRSIGAANLLVQNGFTQIYHMHKGFGAWKYEVTV
jgi:rhodanese-related sulfurtransferase